MHYSSHSSAKPVSISVWKMVQLIRPPLVAFSGHNLSAGNSAVCVLSSLWNRGFPEINDFVSLLVSALIRLGAPPAILESLGCGISTATNQHVSTDARAIAIYRLVSFLQIASR